MTIADRTRKAKRTNVTTEKQITHTWEQKKIGIVEDKKETSHGDCKPKTRQRPNNKENKKTRNAGKM